jgi:ribosome-associated protein
LIIATRRKDRRHAIDTIDVARIAYAACASKKATDVRLLHVAGLTIVADYFVICTAGSSVNARAVADEVRRALKEKADISPIGTEGREEGWWVLVDFGDVVVHVFQDDARQYYAIDETWADAAVVQESEAA